MHQQREKQIDFNFSISIRLDFNFCLNLHLILNLQSPTSFQHQQLTDTELDELHHSHS